MGIPEGSVVAVNLRCGCQQVLVTILSGEQRVRCPNCEKDTAIKISVNSQGDISRFDIEWA